MGDVPVAGDDAGGLLAAMLQGVKGEKGMAGHLFAGRIDAKDATFFVGFVVSVSAGGGSGNQ
jgi:hypothetical protein